MAQLPWQEAIDLKVYLSTAGDFVSLGDRAEYPFMAGGSGYPAGWTMYNSAGANPGDVNWTTQNGRFSVSNASLTDAHAGKFYGVYRDFPVTPGHFYIFTLQARQMDDKTTTQRNIRYEWSTGAGSGSYANAQTDWEQVSIPTGAAPAGATFLRIIIQVVYYWGQGPSTDPQAVMTWGAQFQNVSIIDQLPTYPEPAWDEITCEVRNLGLRYGRDKFVNRYDVASMSLSVINDSGDFTYNPQTTLRPGRFIKVEAQERDSTNAKQFLFYGIVDSLTDAFTLDGHAVTVIQAVDISSLLSNTQVPTATWASTVMKSGSRFAKLLDAVAWHPTMRRVDPGVFNQQAILANGRSVRDELGLIADSEGGYFFASRDGELTYHGRDWNAAYTNSVYAELMAQPVELVEHWDTDSVKFAFNGVIGNYMKVPYFSQFNTVNGGIDIQCRVRVNDWSTLTNQTFCARYEGIALQWIFSKANTGRFLRFFLNAQGSSKFSTAPLPAEIRNGDICWVRVQREDATGIVRFSYALDRGTNTAPTMAQWIQLGADVASTAGAIPNTAAGCIIGARSSGQDPLNGNIWVVSIRDGVNITVTRMYVSTTFAEGLAGATSFSITNPATPVTVYQIAPHTTIQSDPVRLPDRLPVVDDIPDAAADPADMPIICLRELQTSWSRDRVVNEVSVANQGGSAITTIDTASQQKYGPRTYQRMDFLNTNDDITYLTTRTADIMDGYTDAILRVNTVQFRPTKDANVYWFALNVFLNYLVRVRYTHPTQGWGFSVVSHVQGLEHSFTLNDWVVTLFLDEPEAFNYWNDATGAGWDVSEWDTDLWDASRADEAYWNSGQKWSEGHRWG